MRFSALLCAISRCTLYALRVRIGDAPPRLLRNPNHHPAWIPHVEADEALAQQPNLRVALGEIGKGCDRRFLSLGQSQRLAGLETQVPAASADPARTFHQGLQ